MLAWFRKGFGGRSKPPSGGDVASVTVAKAESAPIVPPKETSSRSSIHTGAVLSEPISSKLRYRRFDGLDVILFLLVVGVFATYYWMRPTSVKMSGDDSAPMSPSARETERTGERSRTVSQPLARPIATPRSADGQEAERYVSPSMNADRSAMAITIETASYTPEALRARFQGKVTVAVTITAAGMPEDIEFPAPVPFDLDGPAKDAVRRSRFLAAIRSGKPVASRILIQVPFH